jgi:hypothetical protein
MPTVRARTLLGAALTAVLALTLVPAAAGATASQPAHHRARHHWLTAAQWQCLVDHGVTRLERGVKLDDAAKVARRATLVAALAACGITRPDPVRRHHLLTDAQQQCLVDHGVTRPARGMKLDDATKAAFIAALRACGIIGVPTPTSPPTPPPTIGISQHRVAPSVPGWHATDPRAAFVHHDAAEDQGGASWRHDAHSFGHADGRFGGSGSGSSGGGWSGGWSGGGHR